MAGWLGDNCSQACQVHPNVPWPSFYYSMNVSVVHRSGSMAVHALSTVPVLMPMDVTMKMEGVTAFLDGWVCLSLQQTILTLTRYM